MVEHTVEKILNMSHKKWFQLRRVCKISYLHAENNVFVNE